MKPISGIPARIQSTSYSKEGWSIQKGEPDIIEEKEKLTL